MNTWLVTGGCGFIGAALVRTLLERSFASRIRILDNLSVGTRENLGRACRFQEAGSNAVSEPVELVVGDILDPETCAACCDGVDVVVHLAANTGVPLSVERPRADMEANVIGTFNMLEAARNRRVRRFVFASSGAPAGEVIPPVHEDLPPRPVSPYGASKLAGEGYCSAYYRTFGLETVCLRFSNVYGPDSTHKSSVVARFIRKALCGEPMIIYGDGSQTRDFLYIDDLLEAIVRAVHRPGVAGEVFQIASGRETSIIELARHLERLFREAGIAYPGIRHEPPRPGDVQRNFSDTSKAKRMLAWEATWRLEDGLAHTVRAWRQAWERRALAGG